MSRRLMTLLAALLGALLLTGCGSGNGADDEAETEPGQTRTVTHLAGDSEIPAEPERVVTLWASTMSAMLALGHTPAGYAFNAEPIEGVDVPEGYDLSAMEQVGHSVDLNLESIAAVEPDLILATDVHTDFYDQLSDIAPTVVLDWGGTGAWQSHLDDVADVLGASEAAQQVRTEYEDRAAQVARTIGDPEPIEASVVRFHESELRLEVNNSFAGQVLAEIGLDRPEAQDVTEEDSGYLPLSMEEVSQVDGDVLFAFTIADGPAEAPNLLEEARQTQLWENLTVVQNDAVHQVDYMTWISANYFAAHRVLDDVEEAFS
ncbi:MAG TPA: iron-siderophore ABC transporter substrate-binding protein [Beutenbergiaceae bacterium]|nr:iron-siderophore ABC transporter substrate-binding protein [Beutenbergiaceae bacterium]